MLDALSQDYIRTARAKGLSQAAVLLRHALPGALLPVVSFLGPAVGGHPHGLGGDREDLRDSRPGLALRAGGAAARLHAAMGLVLLYTFLLYTMNFLVDLSYAHPRSARGAEVELRRRRNDAEARRPRTTRSSRRASRSARMPGGGCAATAWRWCRSSTLVAIGVLAFFTPLLPLQPPDRDQTQLQYAAAAACRRCSRRRSTFDWTAIEATPSDSTSATRTCRS